MEMGVSLKKKLFNISQNRRRTRKNVSIFNKVQSRYSLSRENISRYQKK